MVWLIDWLIGLMYLYHKRLIVTFYHRLQFNFCDFSVFFFFFVSCYGPNVANYHQKKPSSYSFSSSFTLFSSWPPSSAAELLLCWSVLDDVLHEVSQGQKLCR